MTFKLTIDTTNAAFDDSPEQEVARILRELAKRIEARGLPPARGVDVLRDTNGNMVGTFEQVP